MIRVFLADDHAVLRRGLQMLLEDTADLKVLRRSVYRPSLKLAPAPAAPAVAAEVAPCAR